MSQVFNSLKEAEQKRMAEHFLQKGILTKWHTKTWDDFTNDNRAKKILRSYEPKKALKEGVGYYLFGANGVGKTLCMNLCFQDLMHAGYSVHIISLTSLITKFTAGWYDVAERQSLMTILQKVDFLGIEEIGKEYKAGSNDLGLMVFDTVLRNRVQMNKPIWFTSNKIPSDLKTIYSEDVASMLRECCVDLKISGTDYRAKISERNTEEYKKKFD